MTTNSLQLEMLSHINLPHTSDTDARIHDQNVTDRQSGIGNANLKKKVN
jgi:hypothetical protein